MSEERTLILVKPDGVQCGHVGHVLSRIENRRYEIKALKMINATKEQLRQHYSQLVDKPYYPGIEEFMTSGPLVAIIAEGDEIIETFRKMAGPTNPSEAMPGTIRGDFARAWGPGSIKNVVHSSDSKESAEKEIKIWFPERN
ncbi:nucleoside-diphosphate kinase [Pediococcus acidilactici]|uniref:nucleoside-diphosphate kinase n=1 Tax=Pediococcus acidilactici TaxID=1254 RepID=UPI000326F668|nr:nucleoside-diphosphate kinase [Pediococcus acidilactici]EOA08406.1 nucleoside-diphosphate kinase [Pediococcus acidilactici D3]MBW4797479.1 nucleoside-diphosphate kinase [Pediococcus acidilactici]MBW9306557.1 nucleoside-diphosphate kinase [Pediococcus acidilactici]MCE5962088.1 nucleoside-diphosphate kinase [Pediococcus acidilactici]MCW8082893.1 nucleoside-diphosphate kinase [Pediococcus acidilactici]